MATAAPRLPGSSHSESSTDETKKDEVKLIDEPRPPWSDLPNDILELVASRIPPFYSAGTCPLLMHFRTMDPEFCHYYSPLHQKTFAVKCPPILSGAESLDSKAGWLLVQRSNSEIFLINPFSGSSHKIPPPAGNDSYPLNLFAVSGPPTSPDFMIIRIAREYHGFVRISLFRRGEWSPFVIVEDLEFPLPFSNPVFYRGLFYCLSITGSLGVFNPNYNSWSILRPRQCPPFNILGRVSLVDCDGELLLVKTCKRGKPLCVFRLNLEDNIWEQVKSMGNRMIFAGNQMIFAGNQTALSTNAQVRGMGNKVYTDSFYERHKVVVHAQVKNSKGGIYFVSECISSAKTTGIGNQRNVCYTVGSHEEPLHGIFRCVEYPFSIWIEPKFDEMK